MLEGETCCRKQKTGSRRRTAHAWSWKTGWNLKHCGYGSNLEEPTELTPEEDRGGHAAACRNVAGEENTCAEGQLEACPVCLRTIREVFVAKQQEGVVGTR